MRFGCAMNAVIGYIFCHIGIVIPVLHEDVFDGGVSVILAHELLRQVQM